MFKKPSKKQLLIRRLIVSALATVLVLIVVTISILFMLGYRLDSGNGRLEQGALLQFDSQPGGADVYVDGALVNGRTATKQTVVAGTHSVLMSRSGYEDWNRTLDLGAGTLTWLDYIRLVPTKRTPQTVVTYPTLVAAEFSPDNKWVLAQEKADAASFHLVDLRSEQVKSTLLNVSPDLITDATTEGVSHTYSLDSWSTGSRYALLRHTFNDKSEWIVMDTQDRNRDKNLTRTLSIDLKDVAFAGTNGSTLYGLTVDGVVRKLDLNGATLSGGLISNVTRFSVFDTSIISYVGTDPADAEVAVAGVYRDGDETPHVLRRVTNKEASLFIAVTKYYGSDYVALAEGDKVSILKGSYPGSSDQDVSSLKRFDEVELNAPVTHLSFSPGGAFLLAQANDQFVGYELEHLRATKGTVSPAGGAAAQPLEWLDSAHLWSDDTSSLVMRDFDGTNAHAIMSVAPGYGASLSQNGRFFYGVRVNDNTHVLQRVRMILE